MKARTKRKLKFYLSVTAIASLTIVVGVVFQYLAWLAWRMKHSLPIKYEFFTILAAILFVMCIADIFLFFRLILKREY